MRRNCSKKSEACLAFLIFFAVPSYAWTRAHLVPFFKQVDSWGTYSNASLLAACVRPDGHLAPVNLRAEERGEEEHEHAQRDERQDRALCLCA